LRIASYKRTKEIVDKYNFVIKKNFGQNFLIDGHVLDKIINSAEISKNDVVIEIGPGVGSLTEELLNYAHKVYAIEIDKSLIPILEDNLKNFDNLEIINQDVLKVDINSIINQFPDKDIKVVANLPYYITTPIIMGFLEGKLGVKSMTVMVQKEVANRMKAKPGTKDYGALTLAINYYGRPYLAANVPRNCFLPRPNIDSAVVRIDIYKCPPVLSADDKLMFELIRMVFNQRRKTLLNAIYNQGGFGFTKEKISEIINAAGFSPEVRGEKFSLEDFAMLGNCFTNAINI
jgi:16S rRNA (adenine1518-N6/adenine1519-N6)-dimethyltransferase